MIEIICLLVGFLVGFSVCLYGYYVELDKMSVEELRAELVDIRNILEAEDELSYQQQAQQQSQDDEMELSPLDCAMNKTHDV